MLISPRDLVERFRAKRRRSGELGTLLERLDEMPAPAAAEPELAELAHDLRRQRERLAQAFESLTACAGCAIGDPLPFGRWPGGGCCGGRTEVLFSDDELAALKLSGTTRARLTTPDSDLAGCIFRGSRGCSLEPGDRPNVCVRYVCAKLGQELRARGERAAFEVLENELRESFERFSKRRADAAVERELAALEQSFDRAQHFSAKKSTYW